MSFKIRDYKHPVTSDIDPTTTVDADELDRSVNSCVARATEALNSIASNYSDRDRGEISLVFRAMQSTHKSIRILLKEESKPTSVDALPLARVQLESLYAICLMLEDPKWVRVYVKDGWKKLYKQALLQKEETKGLSRWVSSLNQRQPHIDNFTHICGVTEAERRTVEKEELGIPLPSGMVEEKIDTFPTPGKVIRKIKVPRRKQMLIRLYAEYEHFSSYVHGLPNAMDIKASFGKYKDRFSTKQKEAVFHKEIADPSLYLSCLSVVQSASELISLYPSDIELRAIVTQAWNLLSNHSLIGKIFWDIRAKSLLGSI